MVHDVLAVMWFFLPAVFANMAPIVVAKISIFSRWNTPMDGGRTFRGKRILGANKTWRGLVSGIVVATLVLWLQQKSIGQAYSWAVYLGGSVNYLTLPTLVLGPVFAIGALGGDAIKSFVKRQMNARPGQPWLFFDQIGEILGAIAVTVPFVTFRLSLYIWAIVLWVVVDILISSLGYLIGVKERPV